MPEILLENVIDEPPQEETADETPAIVEEEPTEEVSENAEDDI